MIDALYFSVFFFHGLDAIGMNSSVKDLLTKMLVEGWKTTQGSSHQSYSGSSRASGQLSWLE